MSAAAVHAMKVAPWTHRLRAATDALQSALQSGDRVAIAGGLEDASFWVGRVMCDVIGMRETADPRTEPAARAAASEVLRAEEAMGRARLTLGTGRPVPSPVSPGPTGVAITLGAVALLAVAAVAPRRGSPTREDPRVLRAVPFARNLDFLLREVRRHSQEWLADQLGWDARKVRRFILGDTTPGVDQVKVIAEALRVEPGLLAFEDHRAFRRRFGMSQGSRAARGSRGVDWRGKFTVEHPSFHHFDRLELYDTEGNRTAVLEASTGGERWQDYDRAEEWLQTQRPARGSWIRVLDHAGDQAPGTRGKWYQYQGPEVAWNDSLLDPSDEHGYQIVLGTTIAGPKMRLEKNPPRRRRR